MAFLKFSRDKRGYEHFYLVQPGNRGKARPRVLYWFRTPPNVKVGRSPFDPEIRRALEEQHPDVAFDWEAIVHTPIPPPAEAERWRERRRVERAMRAASETEDAALIGDAAEQVTEAEAEALPPVAETTEEPLTVEVGEPDATAEPVATSNLSSDSSPSTRPPGPPAGGAAPHGRRRRRRRRGRRKPQVQSSEPQKSEVQDSGEPEDREP